VDIGRIVHHHYLFPCFADIGGEQFYQYQQGKEINSDGEQFNQYQQSKEINSDGEQFHQYQQNKEINSDGEQFYQISTFLLKKEKSLPVITHL
jgi:queuine/archaeosine tRNA-ribosyltransferase